MSTIEDKILDGPRVHYCEADDDDVREDEGGDRESNTSSVKHNGGLFRKPDVESQSGQSSHRGVSFNTGPKGVLEDHRRTMKNLSKTEPDSLEAEFRELMNDDTYLEDLIKKRLDAADRGLPEFGLVYHLRSGQELLDAIDKENPSVQVVAHIYRKYSRFCANVNKSLDELARDLKHAKFVTIDASVTGLSENFKEKGVPSLLIYKGGTLVRSLVQLEDLLDKDFTGEDLKSLILDI